MKIGRAKDGRRSCFWSDLSVKLQDFIGSFQHSLLQEKHPSPPEDVQLPTSPDMSGPIIVVHAASI